MHLLVFTLDDQRYALPVAVVHETIPAVAVTPLPAAPAVVDGVIVVRGTLAPVYDLRVRFGRPGAVVRASEHFVLADAGNRLVALRTDRVLDVVAVDERDVTPASPDDPRLARVAGVARLPDGLVLVQDLAAFLSDAEAATLDRALREHAARTGAAPKP